MTMCNLAGARDGDGTQRANQEQQSGQRHGLATRHAFAAHAVCTSGTQPVTSSIICRCASSEINV